MKKVSCIALIVLHLLNVVGGYWLFQALQDQSEAQLSESFDIDSYSGSQAITIKLPIDVYHGSDLENYERVDGEFEYEGTTYRLIKQKFYNDTAYIVCYKDMKTIVLKNAMSDYVKSFTDNSTEKKSDTKTIFSFLKDYLHQGKIFQNASRTPISITKNVRYGNTYQHQVEFAVDHPPEFVG